MKYLEFLNIEYIVVAIAAMILYLFYFVISKDSESYKNIRSVASVVEDLNREIFYLKKELDVTKKEIKAHNTRLSDEDIYAEVERKHMT